MTFTTLNLTGERVLVKGTDAHGTDGEVVLDARQWNEVNRHKAVASAQEDFDAKVEQFFKPLTDAADAMTEAVKRPAVDPITYMVIHEGTEAVAGQAETVVKLNHDSVVLRLIESGDTDRLVWVGENLEVLEVLSGTSTPTAVDTVADVLGGQVVDDGDSQ